MFLYSMDSPKPPSSPSCLHQRVLIFFSFSWKGMKNTCMSRLINSLVDNFWENNFIRRSISRSMTCINSSDFSLYLFATTDSYAIKTGMQIDGIIKSRDLRSSRNLLVACSRISLVSFIWFFYNHKFFTEPPSFHEGLH